MAYKDEIGRMFDLQKFGMKFGLDNMLSILERLGNPHHGQRFIHLGGTNGKGSVGAMLDAVLREAGYKVGFYTSPHLISFRERIRIGGEMIKEEEVLSLCAELWPLFPDPQAQPTFFEFVTAMAFLYFKRQNVDVAIIECGLGGRLDSTNVIDPLLSCITNVSFDHVEYLGDTLEKIAAEKAGIIKQGRPVVLGEMPPEVLKIMLAKAKEMGSVAEIYGQSSKVEIKDIKNNHYIFDMYNDLTKRSAVRAALPGIHQVPNTWVALGAVWFLQQLGFSISEEAITNGLANTSWPGRGEFFKQGSWPFGGSKALCDLMLDGAHNPAGAHALMETLSSMKYDKLHVILGVMADKDVAGILGPLVKKAHCLYLTRPTFWRAATPELLLEKLQNGIKGFKTPYKLFAELPQAINYAAEEAGPHDLVLISGSLFTVGEARAALLGLESLLETN